MRNFIQACVCGLTLFAGASVAADQDPQPPGPIAQDVVTPDDAVIQGSLAVGLDAVDGEVFGFDSIRLKENNTRLSFVDTSASAGFASNDWTIIANESASGGRNLLGFMDKGATGGDMGADTGVLSFYVLAGAGSDSLMVDQNSRVGLGTATPGLKLHMVNSDTPGVRLDQNGTGGFTPQIWDVAGNEANFFIRDVTGGSRLPFRIRPGAPTSSIDISAIGRVGVGTASPNAKMHVVADSTVGEGMLIGPATTAANTATLHVEGTAFISKTIEIGSSRTRKENIRDLSLAEAKDVLKDLQPVHFNYIADEQKQLGFIAEDVPEMVSTKSRKSLIPMDFVAVLTKVVQDHEVREGDLRKTVQAQQELLKAMEARMAAMEARLAKAEKTDGK